MMRRYSKGKTGWSMYAPAYNAARAELIEQGTIHAPLWIVNALRRELPAAKITDESESPLRVRLELKACD